MKRHFVLLSNLHVTLGVGIVFGLLSLVSCFHSDSDNGIPSFKFNPPVDNTDFSESESFSFDVPVANQVQINLFGKGGNISITGTAAANVVSISGTKTVQTESTEDALEQLQLLDANIQELANEIRITTVQPQDNGGRIYSIDYTITLPNYFEVNVYNVGGNIVVQDIENDVLVENVSGDINVANIIGSNYVALVTGSIQSHVTLPLNGTIQQKTLIGDINLSIPINTSADFSASINSGIINLSNLTLQNEVQTSTLLSGQLGSGQGQITLEVDQVGDINVAGF
ncbi:DUF4097 family beta strand repeat-containing protein [Kaarinaea lacus]